MKCVIHLLQISRFLLGLGMAEKYHCNDCDEDILINNVHLKVPICITCGMVLIKTPSVPQNPYGNNRDSLAGLFELLGADLREAMMEAMSMSQPARQISVSYLNTLGKVEIDCKKTILKDISLHIGPLSLLAVSALFGFIPDTPTTYASPIICGSPIHGESVLTNPSECKGSLVLLERGEVTFASKAVRAMQAGAVSVIIAQTVGVWPFVMADSAKELEKAGVELTIPVVMISAKDAEVVKRYIREKSTKESVREGKGAAEGSATHVAAHLETSLRFAHNVQECSICQEYFEVGNSVLKLPCRHLYHTDCVTNWLAMNNTCPLCRLELPKEAEGRTIKRPVDRTVDNNPSSLYFN